MTDSISLNQELEVDIERLSHPDGHGVARHNNFVIFVPLTAPGDRAVVEITSLKKNFAIASLKKVSKPSMHRREAPCRVAEKCGGCAWQQVEYSEQLVQKQEILRKNLQHLPTFTPEKLHPLVASPLEFRYRNRIQVHTDGQSVGYFARGSNELISIKECLLAEDVLNQNLEGALQNSKGGRMARIEIARSPENQVTFSHSAATDETHQFSQINTLLNERLKKLVVAAAQGQNFSGVLDLYCGSGNLTAPLADLHSQIPVWGVELHQPAIKLAQTLHQQKGNIQWFAAATAQFLRHPPASFRLPHTARLLVVLDPPRPGCDKETLTRILKHRPQKIIYVSCNPSTLSRDLSLFLNDQSYQIDSVQGLDMFPQTAHVEAVVTLSALQH